MNNNYHFFRIGSYFGGFVGADMDFLVIHQNFKEFWMDQSRYSNVTFRYKTFGDNPYANVLFSSKGQYDIANTTNLGSNFIFVSDRMLEIFSNVNVPKYELFPIKYRQRGNIYNGYFLVFLEDYTNYVDFPNSKICYKPYGYKHYIPLKFQTGEDFSAFIRENASMRYEDGNTNLGDFRYPEIRFLDFVYEMDILCIPFMITTFLMSDKLKDILSKDKKMKILYMDWENKNFKNGILRLDPDDYC